MLYAAGREYEAFQIVVRQTSAAITVTNFEINDLVSSSGSRIAASNINIYREMFVSVSFSVWNSGILMSAMVTGQSWLEQGTWNSRCRLLCRSSYPSEGRRDWKS